MTENPFGGSIRGRVLWGAAFLIPVLLWGWCACRAHHHFRVGSDAREAERPMEAGREYQSAIGFYAPFNPWSRAAAESLAAMIQESRTTDPPLAFELEDRLRRSIRGTRWLLQPYADVLASLGTTPGPPLRDPDPGLFFLSLAGLALAAAAPWISPRRWVWRATLTSAGLAAWALALRLC